MAEIKPDQIINILLVDDIVETRENVKKLLSFERDFRVVGMASTGREGIALAKELRPDIVIMDINMPDMDGIQATTQVIDSASSPGVIMMSAQDDPNYMRLAMLAGAKAFITKPPRPEDLYSTIRAVYKRAPVPIVMPTPSATNGGTSKPTDKQNRAGNILVVYSPQGGAGCTTIATNLASGLMREGIRVLLVDANLQFGDVGVFLNLQARSTLVDLVEDVEDLDTDYFENVVLTHDSGLKVLMGPARPELAEKVASNPTSVSTILGKIRWSYDFIIVDTSLHLDEMALSLMDMATRVILVSTPTLASTKNVRYVLDLFDQLNYAPDKIMLVLNRVSQDRDTRKLTISSDKIATFLKRQAAAAIPSDEVIVLDAIRKGIPVVASQRDRSKSPIKELLGLCEDLFTMLMPQQEEKIPEQNGKKTPTRMGLGR
jgi:pilus assembly protein CpaE